MRTALVLGGGGARGAYEAGVVAYLEDELSLQLGGRPQLDILSGTSVGAINACFIAAWNGTRRGQALVDHWRELKMSEVLSFGAADVARLVSENVLPLRRRMGSSAFGLLDVRAFEQRVLGGLPWNAIEANLTAGRLHALSVAATHVPTGHTTIFVQSREPVPRWTHEPNVRVLAARIGPAHALASAAIPLLFPAVLVDGSLYTDGGLRLNVPMSPAIRLGAQRVAVVSLRHRERGDFESSTTTLEAERTGGRERAAYASGPFLVGKALNALLLDHTDQDLQRMQRINSILVAGTRAYGPRFSQILNVALEPLREPPVRYVRHLLLRPSRDLGELASEYARSPEFTKKARGLSGLVVRVLTERDAPEADLVSYLLFDRGYTDILCELGRQDARAREQDWLRFWSDEPEHEAEAAALEDAKPIAV
jgi:NTE family protein